MSVSLLTNISATKATNSLSSVSVNLQQSLNRLSSGRKIVSPADDAGGLAVSMKMSAAIKRQAAASDNLANAMSYLQTQDGALESANQILSRIGELKTMAQDVTKNDTDKANYNTEFAALQEQLSDLSAEKFNGISLFSSSSFSVKTSAEVDSSSMQVGGANLLSSSSGSLFSSSFSDSGSDGFDETISGTGSISVSGGVATLSASGFLPHVLMKTDQTFDGPFTVSFTLNSDNDDARVFLYDGGSGSSGNINTGGVDKTIRVEVGEDRNGKIYVDDVFDEDITTGAAADAQLAVGLSQFLGAGTMTVSNFQITGGGSGGSSTSYGDVVGSSDLDSVDLSDITSAIEEVATFRAQNGAQQSRLQFAKDQLTVNQSNLEAANSRITDVDVASESTQLARFNILQQAGASMLSQANQSQQIALKLIG